jgi:iron-sulfur cluster assembly accessory protein
MTTHSASDSCAAPQAKINPAMPAEGQDEFPVVMTSKAVEKIVEAIKLEGEQTAKTYVGVRISVIGGGCSGFQYNLDFVEVAEEDDIVTERETAKILVDRFSAGYLYGTRLDYVETAHGAGFKFENPNAKRTCGCGSSFSV